MLFQTDWELPSLIELFYLNSHPVESQTIWPAKLELQANTEFVPTPDFLFSLPYNFNLTWCNSAGTCAAPCCAAPHMAEREGELLPIADPNQVTPFLPLNHE